MSASATPEISPFSAWTARHAGIRVPDLEAARQWYMERLDFQPGWTLEHGATRFGFMAPAGDRHFGIELVGNPDGAERPPYDDLPQSHNLMGWHHLCLHCDDVDGSVAALKERGVAIVSGPFDVGALGIRIAFFADPWGNLFELLQPLDR